MKNYKFKNKGMTFPELILATIMLGVFTGIFIMVTKFTSKFFQPLNESAKDEILSSEIGFNDEILSSEIGFSDILNDHFRINKAFDSISDFLSQPGIKKDYILQLKCTALPSLEWEIPGIKNDAIPNSYKICIKSTSLTESNYESLNNLSGKPGIYILYSKPLNGITFNKTPIRRIFCRPKPFCKL